MQMGKKHPKPSIVDNSQKNSDLGLIMKSKLKKFSEFTNTLFPYETAYLLSIQKMADSVKLGILERVHNNCKYPNQFIEYDTSIDKRKYSLLKKWISERLAAIDVDIQFEWLCDMENKIMTDAIQDSEEKQLLKIIRNYNHPSFYFSKLYKLALLYRHFLLIRIRLEDHQVVESFIEKNKAHFERSEIIFEKTHQATTDIVRQYSENKSESNQWEEWLTSIFYDKQLDGHNRYMALVKLSFICFNYRKYDLLSEKMDYLAEKFKNGEYYSRRILANYYNSRLMLHTSFKEYDKAIRYGYLAIKGETHDSILYVTNLSAVLLGQDKVNEAFSVLKNASDKMKRTKNFHSKIGYVAFYINCLNKLGQHKNAENQAETFLLAYEKEILQYRWHIFFSAYLDTLLYRQKYSRVLRMTTKYKLIEKDTAYQYKANYLPTILWQTTTARYLNGEIKKQKLVATMQSFLDNTAYDHDRLLSINRVITSLNHFIPEIISSLKRQ